MVREVTAVGKYAGRPLKAGDAAQPGAALPALCLLVSGRFELRRTRNGLFGVRDRKKDGCRTRNARFGVRDRENDGCRTRIGLFGVRGRAKVICERKPLSTVRYNICCLRPCGVLRGVNLSTPKHAR